MCIRDSTCPISSNNFQASCLYPLTGHSLVMERIQVSCLHAEAVARVNTKIIFSNLVLLVTKLLWISVINFKRFYIGLRSFKLGVY